MYSRKGGKVIDLTNHCHNIHILFIEIIIVTPIEIIFVMLVGFHFMCFLLFGFKQINIDIPYGNSL